MLKAPAAIQSKHLIKNGYDIHHHGAVTGVTGSCHELFYLNHRQQTESILIDCGLFQGIEAESEESDDVGGSLLATQIPFAIDHIKALVVTHVHIDHVGRIPHLLVKGFKGPIYCSQPSAKLLPLVLEDAVKIGFTRNKRLIEKILKHIEKQIVPLEYGKWQSVSDQLKIKLKPAGHILGSAYVTCKLTPNVGGSLLASKQKSTPMARIEPSVIREWLSKNKPKAKTIIFSGDLGAPHTPILNAPKSPWKCDVLVMESTYGNKNHESRKNRRQRLKAVIEKALQNQGTVLIPAFSIGRTQELLYELEEIAYRDVGTSFLSGTKKRVHRDVGTSFLSGTKKRVHKDVGTSFLSGTKKRVHRDVGTSFLSGIKKRVHRDVGTSFLSGTKKRVHKDVGTSFLSGAKKRVPKDVGTSNMSQARSSTNKHQKSVRPVPNTLDTLAGHAKQARSADRRRAAFDWQNLDWNSLQIIIDSPLASKFTGLYSQLSPFWDKEAQRKLKNKRNPLKNNNVLTINTHKEHLSTVNYLAEKKRPAIVIAASGMCNGGRIMNYLKAMLSDKRHDVLFIGYQAQGTIGRKVQQYGPAKNGRKTGYVDTDGQRIPIQADIHTIGGYSAHAGQKDLLNLVKRMWFKPKEIRLIHGDEKAKETLKDELNKKYPKIKVWIPS